MANRNIMVATGLVVFAGAAAYFPIYYTQSHKEKNMNFQQQKDPLTGSQVMRGAYINTGSKDAGADPDWDWETRTYKGKSAHKLSDYER